MNLSSSLLRLNPLANTDSYKLGHYLQYPPKLTKLKCYLEARWGMYPETTQFGNLILGHQLNEGFTRDDVMELAEFAGPHGEPFPKDDWLYILDKYGGQYPIKLRAVEEGALVPTHNVLLTSESTDERVPWVTSWLEPKIMQTMWYCITVATRSASIRNLIYQNLVETADDPDGEIWFKTQDFGCRGVPHGAVAQIGGAAHLVNQMGSDTIPGVILCNKLYKPVAKMSGFSIFASEHSSITTWIKNGGERSAFKNMAQRAIDAGMKMLACVSDSYDLDYAMEFLWGDEEIRKMFQDNNIKLVARPDSGPPEIKGPDALDRLASKWGEKYNTKSYRVLNGCGIIWGDGMNEEGIRKLFAACKAKGYSGSNVGTGSGGYLLQQVNRDTEGFAYKCSSATIDGQMVDVFKDPKTDPEKKSKRGELDLVYHLGKYQTIAGHETIGSVLKTFYHNGLSPDYNPTIDEIRNRRWGKKS